MLRVALTSFRKLDNLFGDRVTGRVDDGVSALEGISKAMPMRRVASGSKRWPSKYALIGMTALKPDELKQDLAETDGP
jgi:hypothetical protein